MKDGKMLCLLKWIIYSLKRRLLLPNLDLGIKFDIFVDKWTEKPTFLFILLLKQCHPR